MLAATAMFCSVALSAVVTDEQKGYVQMTQPRVPSGIVGPDSNRRMPVPASYTFIHNNVPMWQEDLPEATMYNFPPHYLTNRYILVTPHSYKMAAGSDVTFYCPDGDECEVVVFLYECYPCVTAKGNLPAALKLDGYERSRCAPVFKVKEGGSPQKMTAFIKTIPGKSYHTVKIPEEAHFFAVGFTNHNADQCGKATNKGECVKDSFCTWNPLRPAGSQCLLSTCISKGPGACDTATCAHKELP